MLTALWLLALVFGFVALAYANASGPAWIGAVALTLGLAWTGRLLPLPVLIALATLILIVAIPLNVPRLRRAPVGDPVPAPFRRTLPAMAPTEREAIEAGTVGWDGELFSGRPRWAKLVGFPAPRLTSDEQRF